MIMKKTILALSVLLIVFAGFFVPNTGNVNAQTEQAPESVLEVIDYKTDEVIRFDIISDHIVIFDKESQVRLGIGEIKIK